jgi:hypothetical protein
MKIIEDENVIYIKNLYENISSCDIVIRLLSVFDDERNKEDVLMKGIFSILLLGLHEIVIAETGLELEDVYEKFVKNIFRLIKIYLNKKCDSSINTSISPSLIFESISVIFSFLEKNFKNIEKQHINKTIVLIFPLMIHSTKKIQIHISKQIFRFVRSKPFKYLIYTHDIFSCFQPFFIFMSKWFQTIINKPKISSDSQSSIKIQKQNNKKSYMLKDEFFFYSVIYIPDNFFVNPEHTSSYVSLLSFFKILSNLILFLTRLTEDEDMLFYYSSELFRLVLSLFNDIVNYTSVNLCFSPFNVREWKIRCELGFLLLLRRFVVSEYICIENIERQNLMKMLIYYSKKITNSDFYNVEKNEVTEFLRMNFLTVHCTDYDMIAYYIYNNNNNNSPRKIYFLSFFLEGGCLDWVLTIYSALNPYGESINLSPTSPPFIFYPSLPKHSPCVSEILSCCSLTILFMMKYKTPSSILRYVKENILS